MFCIGKWKQIEISVCGCALALCLSFNFGYKYKLRMKLVDHDATLTRDACSIHHEVKCFALVNESR